MSPPPSMRVMFAQHHRISNEELHKLWDKAVFAIDANVLLNIYRYNDQTRQDIFSVFAALGDRLWVPYQSAKEFYSNRLTVIAEQKRKYRSLLDVVERSLNEVGKGEFSKSNFLPIDDVAGLLKDAVDRCKDVIASAEMKHPDLLTSDPYLEEIANIVGTRIGVSPEDSKLIENYKLAQERIDLKRPPGYKDAQKPESERYGDVLIWFELLDRAKELQQPIVFITDDVKEDWWQIISGEKKGPRPELREEILQFAGQDLLLMQPSTLLAEASSRLALPVGGGSIQDAEQISKHSTTKSSRESSFTKAIGDLEGLFHPRIVDSNRELIEFQISSDDAVSAWLQNDNQAVWAPKDAAGVEYLVSNENGIEGFDVKPLMSAKPKDIETIISRLENSGALALKYEGIDRHSIVMVLPLNEQGNLMSDHLDFYLSLRKLSSDVYVGFNNDGRFQPVAHYASNV